MNIPELIFDALTKHHCRCLLSDTSRRLTGQEIDQHVNSIAHELKNRDIISGARVGICLRDQLNSIMMFLACWKLGAIPVMFDFRIKPAERPKLVEIFNLTLFIEDSKRTEVVDRFVRWNTGWLDGQNAKLPLQPLDRDATGCFLVSSGTTGTPKMYALSHEVLVSRMTNESSFSTDGQRLFVSTLPVAFAATHNHIFPCLINGIEFHFFPVMFTPSKLAEALIDRKVTGVILPPLTIKALIDEVGPVDKPVFPDLLMLKCVGSAPSAEIMRNAYGRLTPGFVSSFGSGIGGVASLLVGQDAIDFPESAGKIIDGVRVEILDRDTGRILPNGSTGIIKIYSDSVASGVFGEGQIDEQVGEGWAITGDIGLIDNDGYLFITNRMSDSIIRAGVAVSPNQTETVLKSHPDILDVAVIGVDDDRVGEEICAVVVAPTLSEAQIMQFCMESFNQDKRPRLISLVESLPYTRNGKLDRKAVRKNFT